MSNTAQCNRADMAIIQLGWIATAELAELQKLIDERREQTQARQASAKPRRKVAATAARKKK